MEIYAVNGNIRNLLLVRDGNYVVNGGWKFARDANGYYIPGDKKLRLIRLGKAPKRIPDEHGWTDYNTMLWLAFDRYHLPLFDEPRDSHDDARTRYCRELGLSFS